MKKILFLLTFLIVAAGVSGCAGGKKVPEKPAVVLQNFTPENENTGFNAASRFASGFASAVKAGDFSLWQREMPLHIQQKVNAEIFGRMSAELKETFGAMSAFRFLGTLKKGNLRDHLWVLSFDKDNKTHEVIYLVRVFCDEKGQPEISGFGIRRN